MPFLFHTHSSCMPSQESHVHIRFFPSLIFNAGCSAPTLIRHQSVPVIPRVYFMPSTCCPVISWTRTDNSLVHKSCVCKLDERNGQQQPVSIMMNQQRPFNKLLADPTAQIPLSTDALAPFKQTPLCWDVFSRCVAPRPGEKPSLIVQETPALQKWSDLCPPENKTEQDLH